MIWELLDLPFESWIWTGLELGVCFLGKSQMLLLTEPSCNELLRGEQLPIGAMRAAFQEFLPCSKLSCSSLQRAWLYVTLLHPSAG